MSSSFELLDDARYIPLVVLSSTTSLFSMLGSGCVLYMSSREGNKIMHRVMFGLSLADFVSSTSSFLMPFLIPSSLGLPGAVGNTATCSMAGFFLMTFIMVGCCYNAGLSLYFFLVVCRSWKERDFQRPVEMVCHGFAWTVPVAFNIVAATLQTINPSPLINNACTYATSPWDCNENDEIDCERASRAQVTTMVTLGSLYLFTFTVIGFFGTFFVWSSVKHTFQRSSIYRFQGSSQSDERILQVRTQAILYSMAYLNTIFWPILGAAFSNRYVHTGAEIQQFKLEPAGYAFQVLYFTFYPMQGFLNFFIYTRSRVQQLRKLEQQRSLWQTYKEVVLTSLSELPSTQQRSTTRGTQMGLEAAAKSTEPHTPINQPEAPPADEEDSGVSVDFNAEKYRK